MRTFTLIIERNKKGTYKGYIVELPGCEAKGATLDDLRTNIRGAIFMHVGINSDYKSRELEFIGIQRVKIPIKDLDECS